MYIVKLETGEVKVLCYQKMSWNSKMSRFHPLVTVSYHTNQAIFTHRPLRQAGRLYRGHPQV
jgi:hypothetical protein